MDPFFSKPLTQHPPHDPALIIYVLQTLQLLHHPRKLIESLNPPPQILNSTLEPILKNHQSSTPYPAPEFLLDI